MPEQGGKSGDDCVFESVPKDYNRPIAACCEILNTGQRWETFERFWHCSSLRQSYTNACKRDAVQDWRTEVYQTLVDIGGEALIAR